MFKKRINELENEIRKLRNEIASLNNKLDYQNEKRKQNFVDFIKDLAFRKRLIETKLVGSVRDTKLKKDLLEYNMSIFQDWSYFDCCDKIVNDFDFSSVNLVKSCLEEFESRQKTLDTYSSKKATPAKIAVANICKKKKEK